MDAEPMLTPPPATEERPLPTITDAERLAAKVGALIDEIEAIIPDLEAPHPRKSGHGRAARTVSRAFILMMLAAIEDEPDWQSLGYFDPEQARAVMQFIDAFRPVARRLAMLAAKLNFTMASRKANIAIAAMNTYRTAKCYARNLKNAAMGAPVNQLRHALGRKNGRSASRRQA
jgi:hypothetical protein